MKVLLISDFGIRHSLGGAQRSNQLILDEGIQRGHDISIYHYDTDQSVLWENIYDIVISSNLEVLSKTNPMIIQYCTSAHNHVRLEHDFCRYLDRNVRQLLYETCQKTFFLTNYHYKKFVEYYGDYFINVEIVPDPIDMKKFYNMELERKDDILYVGFMHPLKGTNNFMNYVINNPDKSFTVAGWGDNKYEDFMRNTSNVNFLGKIDYADMMVLYNTHKQMYYKPEFDEPFCRAVGEALMCGVHIIGDSDKIGSLHMLKEDPINFAKKCNDAAKTFWETLECL
jgi:glycosyltransferase involved in cell wall biosynthesis